MARQRNYKLEYQRRLARAEARGLTRKQARGHGGDATKSQPKPLVQPSAVYNISEASGYLAKLGEGRRAKLVAMFEDGTSRVILGSKGGMRPSELRRLLREMGPDLREQSQRYREQARAGTLPPGRDLLIGYQVIWQ